MYLIHLGALSLGPDTCSIMFPKPKSKSLEGKVGVVVGRGRARLEAGKHCEPSLDGEGSENDSLALWSSDLPIHQNTWRLVKTQTPAPTLTPQSF